MSLLAIGKPDGCRDLRACHVLKKLEVFFGAFLVAGRLQRAGERELRRRMQGLDRKSLFEYLDCLVELLQLPIADTLEVVRIDVARIKLDRLLEAPERSIEVVVGMLGEAKVV